MTEDGGEWVRDLRALEPKGYRVGWAPNEKRIVLQLGDPDNHATFGLPIELAEALARDLAAKAHQHRDNPGRPT